MALAARLDHAIKYALQEVQKCGNPMLLVPAVRTVVIVHAAQGLIDNGGFQYFFESDFPGNPPYTLFIEAYQDIGANEEADVIAEAVRLFPFLEPQSKKDARNDFLDKCRRAETNPLSLDDKLCGNKRVWQLLEEYVLRHEQDFPGG